MASAADVQHPHICKLLETISLRLHVQMLIPVQCSKVNLRDLVVGDEVLALRQRPPALINPSSGIYWGSAAWCMQHRNPCSLASALPLTLSCSGASSHRAHL